MSRRRGEKRGWDGEKGSLGDVNRRRSPRLLGSAFAPARPTKTNGGRSQKSNKNNNSASVGGDANTGARGTASKRRQLLFCNSDDYEEDNGKKIVLGLRCNRGTPNHKDNVTDGESWLPDKSILELILDTLQRRDTYDIFAEPVDPSEVEEYYEIIKEPMDFGTMRAKLHEGMYKNLRQFEHDTFLIFGNAMHFNTSGSVYFRQARALEELAKRVFHFLKTDPENFKLNFTATRRRSSRRLNGEISSLNISAGRKLAKESGSNSTCTALSRKGCQRKTTLTEIDRRSTYKPWMFQLDESNSTLPPIYNGTKPLVCGNSEDIGYKESLMLFVKDLGPTAHRVANRKLQGSSMQSYSSNLGINCLNPTSSLSQREFNHSLSDRSTLPATSPSSQHLFSIKSTNDSRQPSNVSYHANTMPPPVTDLKRYQVGYLDLNHVQAIPSSSCSHIDIPAGCSQDEELRTPPSRMLGFSKFSPCLSPADHSITTAAYKDAKSQKLLPSSASVCTQLTYNFASSKLRLRESSSDVDNIPCTNGQSAALQMPRDTTSEKNSNQNRLCFDNHHMKLPYMSNTRLPNLSLEL